MSKINDLFIGLVTDYSHSYPGFFKKQRRSSGLDMFYDYQVYSRLEESVDKRYDLDSINL
ncbi:MAG: hypothetical protein JXA46_04515 [Dehalococcoidales bacterium]|nr:hypothetical protein [Dehalococcoidales bacterium]